MSGLQTVKLTLRGSPITLISIDTDLIKECERVLESHFSRKSPAFSEADDAEFPGTLGSFQIASALAIDIDSPPLADDSLAALAGNPESQYYAPEIETNAAVFTDEIDKVKFSPDARAEFAPVITEVCSLNTSHPDDWWPPVKPEPRDLEPSNPWTSTLKPDLEAYVCAGCGATVACNNRANHERQHATQCRVCGWQFKSLRGMSGHIKSHLYKERRKKHLHPLWRRKECKAEEGGSPVKQSGKKRPRCPKGQAPGRLACALRSRDAPPILLPFDIDVPDLEVSDSAVVGRRNRPRDPLSVPVPAAPLPSSPCRRPFVSVLSVERFASVTAGRSRPKSGFKAGPKVESTRFDLSQARPKVKQSNSSKHKDAALKMWQRRRQAAGTNRQTADANKLAEVRTLGETASKGKNLVVGRSRNGVVGRRKNGVISTSPVAVASDQVPDRVPVPVESATLKGDLQSPVSGKGTAQKCVKWLRTKFSCNKCKAGFASKEERRKHLRTHRLPCKFCPARFLNTQYLDLHAKIFHPEILLQGAMSEMSSGQTEAVLEEGSQAIDDSFDLRELCPNSDDSASDNERSRSPGYHPYRQVPKRRVHLCARCPVRCANAGLLRRHAQGHTAPDRIECATCCRLFRNERTRAAHVEKTHGVELHVADAGPLPCRGCDALAVSPMRLAEHYCTAHINLALLGCGICRLVLTLAQWRTHASTHI